MGYDLKLLDAFSVTKSSEEARFLDHGNRMLLWHGSRLTNWAGIFGAGLKIAPPEAPCTGYMVRRLVQLLGRGAGARGRAGAGCDVVEWLLPVGVFLFVLTAERFIGCACVEVNR